MIDITGMKFGRLQVIEVAEKRNRQLCWRCKCDCGNTVIVRSNSLRTGRTKSCGCYNREVASKTLTEKQRKFNNYEILDGYAVIIDDSNNRIKVDIEDVKRLVNMCSWSVDKLGYANGNINGHHVKIHTIIMDAPVGMVVDHVNHDTSDNRKCNLRICTQAENMRNSKLSRRNTSGVKGVSFHKRAHKWQATIRYNKRLIHLGSFDSIEEAEKARKKAESQYFGKFAYKENMENA